MRNVKRRKGLLSAGLLLMGLMVLLGTLAVGYGLWSKVLTIEGTVNTGEVNAEFSLAEIDESFDFDALCPPGDGGLGYSIGQDCDNADEDNDPTTGLNDDMEIEGKDIATCTAVRLDGLDNPGYQTLQVTITNGYPSFNCFVRWDVHNNGTIPIKVHSPEYFLPDGNDGWVSQGSYIETPELHVNAWPPPCYTNDVQLEVSDRAYCNLHVHVKQDAQGDSTYTFMAKVFVHQWNEEPQ